MPSKSQKQHNLMEMVAHGGHPKGGKGPSKAVAQEFVQADKQKHFKKASPIGSKSTQNVIKDPRSLVGFSPR